MQTRHVAATLTLILCTFTAAVLADSRIEFKATEGTGSTLQTILVGQGKMRTDDGKASVILDPTAGMMMLIDHDKKTFMRFGNAEIDQLTKTLADAMKQMEDTLASLPPEMRERMKGMMGGAALTGAAVTVVDTGERSTVAGRDCRIFRTQTGGKTTAETCMADASAIELPAADRATLLAAIAWSKDLADKLSKGPMSRIVSAVPFTAGLVPLRQTSIAANGTRSTSEFVGVTAATISADLLAPPANYKEQKLEIPKIGK